MNMLSSKKKGFNMTGKMNQEEAMREMKPKGERRSNYKKKNKSAEKNGGGNTNIIAKSETGKEISIQRNQVS